MTLVGLQNKPAKIGSNGGELIVGASTTLQFLCRQRGADLYK